jgi:hypothetical protein
MAPHGDAWHRIARITMNERQRKGSIGFTLGGRHGPPDARKSLVGPGGREPDQRPDGPPDARQDKPTGVKAKRYNLTVRLSPDERERLAAIGRSVGAPDPLTLAETVRWLIRQHRI